MDIDSKIEDKILFQLAVEVLSLSIAFTWQFEIFVIKSGIIPAYSVDIVAISFDESRSVLQNYYAKISRYTG